MAPVNVRSRPVMRAVVEYATVYSRGYQVPCRVQIPASPPLFLRELKTLEIAYQVRLFPLVREGCVDCFLVAVAVIQIGHPSVRRA